VLTPSRGDSGGSEVDDLMWNDDVLAYPVNLGLRDAQAGRAHRDRVSRATPAGTTPSTRRDGALRLIMTCKLATYARTTTHV